MPSYSKEVKVPGRSAQQLFDVVAQSIDRFLEKAMMGGKFELQRDPASRTFTIKSSMFNAKLVCTDGALKLDGSLSLMAAPFRGKLDEGIDKWIAKNFTQQG